MIGRLILTYPAASRRIGGLLMLTLVAAALYGMGISSAWIGKLAPASESFLAENASAARALSAAVIAIVMAGVTIIFSEGGGGVRKLAFVGLGIAIMFAAVSFFLDFFGFAGGALI